MKKILTIALSLCVLLTLLVGCNTNTNTNSSTDDTTSSSSSVSSEESSSSISSEETSDSLADYAQLLNETYEAMSTDELAISCAAQGKSLVITFTYGIDGITEEVAQAALDASESTYSTVLSTVQAAGIECTSVTLEFKSKDGTVLASKEYK